jgi:hypothetical protein
MSSAPSLNHSAADKKPDDNATREVRWMSYNFADETTFFCGDRGREEAKQCKSYRPRSSHTRVWL